MKAQYVCIDTDQ